MLVLHASLEKGKMFLWAEKQFTDIPRPIKQKGRIPLNPPPRPHPFAADPEQLGQACPDLNITKKECTKGLVWLPSQSHAPYPSNAVLGAVEESGASNIAPWAIWMYPMQPEAAITCLQATYNKEIIAPGIFVGKEFTYLGNVVRFVLSLVVRQRYLPSARHVEEGFETIWEPIFLGLDKQRLIDLQAFMPDICRALTTSLKQAEAPSISPEMTLAEVLIDILNSVVRSAARNDNEKTKRSSILHDAWVKGLVSEKRLLNVKEIEGGSFFDTIQEWQKPIKNTASSPFKMCMRLEEPKETTKINANLMAANAPWKVSYMLQAFDDPSLFVSTKDVWNPKGVKRKVLERPNFNARQFVLTSLGMATGLCPLIEPSLHEPIPTSFSVDSSGAFTFLQDYTPRLEDAGFSIICPKWWKKSKLTAQALVESPPFKSKRQQSIWADLNVDWQIYLGDLGLSKEELYQLSLLKDPIIKMRGEWVLLSKEDIQKAIQFLENKPYQPKNALDLLQIHAGIPEHVHGIKIEGAKATGWVAEFLEALRNNVPMQQLEPPKGFNGVLRPYQLRGYSWMSFLQQWQLGACLADDMGLGKTPQTLAMMMRGWEEEAESGPCLLVCPTSLTGNWSREASKFVPDLPVHVHHGTKRKKDDLFAEHACKVGLVITSYALLLRDVELLKKVKWRGIILDEAQNIKNAQTKQTKAAHQLKADYRLALTGTPVENNVGDLWSIMHFLNPGYLGTQDQFRKSFFTPIQIDRSPNATETLKQLTKPLVLRRLKTNREIISDLPDKMEMKVYCSLTQEQITLYETVVADANNLLENAEGIARKGIILATLTKLKQICNHPTQLLGDGSHLHDRSGKLSRLQEMLEEIHSVGDHCLIFTQYTEMGTMLKSYLEEQHGKEILFLHGGTSKKMRDTMIERFQKEENGPSVFILSLKAGGVGLNLTRANHVFHFDRWWNPAVENQATDRAFRIGQKKNVQVHKFICSGTLEERIDEMIESKKEVAANVVGTGETWLTELSTDSLKELWKLQKTAI